MNAGIRVARLVLCICGAVCYGAAWWTLLALLTAFSSDQGFGLLIVTLFVGLATGTGATLSRNPSFAGRRLLRPEVPVAATALLAGGVSALVMSNRWLPAITFVALAIAVAVFAVVAGLKAGAPISLRASLVGPLFGLLSGFAFGLSFALTVAAIYSNPCFPGHRYCLDPGRWYFLPIGLEAGLAAGLWLGLAASAALAAATVLRWTLPAPATR